MPCPPSHLLAARYLDDRYSPDAVAAEIGVPAATIRRIAAELAHTAFETPVVIDRPWTDWAGRRHDTMIGRPISIHAMRGISAHSNGFHTCRALHVLQALLGAIDTPGAFRYEPPYPKSVPPAVKPAGRLGAEHPARRTAARLSDAGRKICWSMPNGEALRIDKAFSWEAPLAAHGMMHTVIANAVRGDPYRIDTLFLYMSNMGWNSAMNTAETMAMLAEKNPETGDYRIPHIIYSDAYYSETVAYADLILPDTTYLERYDCISLLDRPISDAEAAADAIRQPVIKPDRDVRPFQDVLIELGARLQLPGLINADGTPKYPGLYPDYIVNHQRSPGVGLLAGWRGANGGDSGTGAVNPRQLERYIENECFWRSEMPEEAHYFKPWNAAYLKWATRDGLPAQRRADLHRALQRDAAKIPARCARTRCHSDPGAASCARRHLFRSAANLVCAVRRSRSPRDYGFHALTQRPMAMYHSWGSQNAWLRQIHGDNLLHINRLTARKLGIADGDWVTVTSAHSSDHRHGEADGGR